MRHSFRDRVAVCRRPLLFLLMTILGRVSEFDYGSVAHAVQCQAQNIKTNAEVRNCGGRKRFGSGKGHEGSLS